MQIYICGNTIIIPSKQDNIFPANLYLMSWEIASGAISAGHDRSDGGLASLLLEMAFAGQVGCGLDVDVPAGGDGVLDALFSEEVCVCVCVCKRVRMVLCLASIFLWMVLLSYTHDFTSTTRSLFPVFVKTLMTNIHCRS